MCVCGPIQDTRVALLSESTVSYSKEPPDQHNTSSFTAAPVSLSP